MTDQIQQILTNEGKPTDDPSDAGGPTAFGISKVANPDLWVNGPPTQAQAIQRYQELYIKPFADIKDINLQHQLVDFGVTTGPQQAIKVLQQTLGLAADGVIGPKTLASIDSYPGGLLFGTPVSGSVRLNMAIRDARILFYASITKRLPQNLKFILGWLSRAMEFR